MRFATPVERRLRGAARGTFREELNQANEELVLRLDRLREEFTRIHTKLPGEHSGSAGWVRRTGEIRQVGSPGRAVGMERSVSPKKK